MPAGLLIYETGHHEMLPAMLDLAELYFEHISVFLKELAYQNICSIPAEERWPKVNFYRQAKSVSNRAFIRDAVQFSLSNRYTHFHISTLDNNLLYFAAELFRLRGVQLSLSVQAVRGYSSFKFGNLRDITESLAKLVFHRRIKHYRVLFPRMKDVFCQYFPDTNCQFIPSRFYSGKQNRFRSRTDFLKIVIPGSINPGRRDYSFAVAFARDYLQDIAAQTPIELVILGSISSIYGLRLKDELKAFESRHFVVKYYLDYIPQAEYEQQLASADILWSPLNINTKSIRGIPEVYGYSMATGLISDQLLSSCPTLVPAGFEIPAHYESAMIVYESASDLAARIAKLITDDDNDRNGRIYNELSFFSKDHFKKEFEDLFAIDK
jgi:hypothetical protein